SNLGDFQLAPSNRSLTVAALVCTRVRNRAATVRERSRYDRDAPYQLSMMRAVARNLGSISSPSPGPAGTLTTPFLITNCGHCQGSFSSLLRYGNSIISPIFGIADANCRILTAVGPVCVLWLTIFIPAFRAIRATRAARMNPPL